MERYLNEEDKWKEFLVCHQDKNPQNLGVGCRRSQEPSHNVQEWNRAWERINQDVAADAGKSSSYTETNVANKCAVERPKL